MDSYEYVNDETGEVLEAALTVVEPKVTEVMVSAAKPPQVIPPEMLPDLDAMEAGFSLAAKYIEFEEKGQTVRAVLSGFTSMLNQQGKEIPVAVFQNRDGVFVNAGANLVQQVRNLQAGTPIQITYNGKEKTKNGNMVKIFDVRLLTPRKTVTPTPAPIDLPASALPSGPGVQIPSANGNGHKKPKIETKRWSELVKRAIDAGYVENNTAAPHRLLQIVASDGFTNITNDNLNHVWAAIERHYTTK